MGNVLLIFGVIIGNDQGLPWNQTTGLHVIELSDLADVLMVRRD